MDEPPTEEPPLDDPRPHDNVIIVAGMYRSASTFLFNLIRVMLKHKGKEVWGGGTNAFLRTAGTKHDAYVVKEHRWIEEKDLSQWLSRYADQIYTSRRPLKEAWLSKRRFEARKAGHGENTEANIPHQESRKWVRWLERWQAQENHVYCMRWHWLQDDGGPYRIAKDVAHHLDVSINPGHVLRHLRSTMAPPKGQKKDPDTLVFQEHYTSRDYDDIRSTLRVPDDAPDQRAG